jgi:3-oxoacyl-[acyl-carrier protein] reductase
MSKLEGKVALVTGASKGIGAGIAKELASAGAAVVVNYASDRPGAEAVVNAITKAKGRTVAAQSGVSKPADVARLFAEAERSFGTLDIVVNNARVYSTMPLEAMTEEEFHREFNTNLLGPMLVIRESLQHFGSQGGSIINIGSAASRMHPANYSVYAATKGALDAVTGVLAKELAAQNIRVNSVNPGATLSEGTRTAGLLGIGSEYEKQFVAMTPLGRVGTPSDIAKVVVFLASDDSGWLPASAGSFGTAAASPRRTAVVRRRVANVRSVGIR